MNYRDNCIQLLEFIDEYGEDGLPYDELEELSAKESNWDEIRMCNNLVADKFVIRVHRDNGDYFLLRTKGFLLLSELKEKRESEQVWKSSIMWSALWAALFTVLLNAPFKLFFP